ncbi:MAG: RnfABCDGE type electron transport complex subunit B [Halioglobus sp.]|nr:RnfABCDGE type electron transport complex subunit B [Halioglobus sp.]
MTAFAALGAMGALTFLLASVLLLASRALRVEEDPRVDRVEELLPHNNCGACGYAGCRAFAEALVAGEAVPAACTVASAGERAAVAALLGVDVGVSVRRVARLACAGGTNVARERARYAGPSSCVEAAQVGRRQGLCLGLSGVRRLRGCL